MTKSSLDALSRTVAHKMYESCRKCGNTWTLEVSHFVRRGSLSVRWCPKNLDVFCRKCHTYFEMSASNNYIEWKEMKDGKEAVKELLILSNPAAYKVKYSLNEFMKLTSIALRQAIASPLYSRELYAAVFEGGLGVVPIPVGATS